MHGDGGGYSSRRARPAPDRRRPAPPGSAVGWSFSDCWKAWAVPRNLPPLIGMPIWASAWRTAGLGVGQRDARGEVEGDGGGHRLALVVDLAARWLTARSGRRPTAAPCCRLLVETALPVWAWLARCRRWWCELAARAVDWRPARHRSGRAPEARWAYLGSASMITWIPGSGRCRWSRPDAGRRRCRGVVDRRGR